MSDQDNAEPQTRARSSTNRLVALVFFSLGLLVLAAGIVAMRGVSGLKRMSNKSKIAEAREHVPALAQGIKTCAEQRDAAGAPRGLPPSSAAVPSSLDATKGVAVTTAADWADEAYRCAGFAPQGQQHFRYQWQQRSPTQGTARAEADLDGDGVLDVGFEMDVTCASGGCWLGPLKER